MSLATKKIKERTEPQILTIKYWDGSQREVDLDPDREIHARIVYFLDQDIREIVAPIGVKLIRFYKDVHLENIEMHDIPETIELSIKSKIDNLDELLEHPKYKNADIHFFRFPEEHPLDMYGKSRVV